MRRIYLILLLLSWQWAFANTQNSLPIFTPSIKVELEDKTDLEKSIAAIFPEKNVSDAIEMIDESRFVVQLFNDYNGTSFNSTNQSDDIGPTHGLRVAFVKNIKILDGDADYLLIVSYESKLYTNNTKPKEFNENFRDVLYLNEDGYWQTDQYFKEENLFSFLIEKVKTSDSFYWKAGGGYQEINAEDSDRGFFLSSLTQQGVFHRAVNDLNGATLREYRNISQPGVSERSVFVEGEIGRDKTMTMGDAHRTFSRVGLQARLTGVEDASFVGAYLKVGADVDPQVRFIPNIRLYTSINYKRFSNSDYMEHEVGIELHGSDLNAKLVYIRPLTDDPKYLNALPVNFENRDAFTPSREGSYWLIFEKDL